MPELLRYLLISTLLILTGSGLPIPEEAIVVGAGVAASLGEIDPWYGALACIVGALLGDLLAYTIGRFFGRRLLANRSWFARLMHAEREKQIEAMIYRHGLKVFFLARFLVGLRAPIYLTAGILKVPVRTFLFADAFTALVVIGLFFGLAYRYGEPVRNWIRGGEVAFTVVVVVGAAIAAVVFWVVHKRRQRAAAALAELSAPLGEQRTVANEAKQTVN